MLAAARIGNGTLWEANERATQALEWERTTDPTPNKILGKFLSYQLTLTNHNQTEVLKVLRKFGLEYIHQLSTPQAPLKHTSNRHLPETDWSGGFDHLFASLSFTMRYALQVLLTHHYIVFTHANQVATLVARIQASKVQPEEIIRICYRKRANAWSKLLKVITEASQSKPEKKQPISNCIKMRRVLIAPLRVIVEPPEADLTNRVVRLYEKYLDRFVRATFVDDDYGSVHQVKNSSDIAKRFKSIVQYGFYIAGEHFVFLGYSSSQLREQSCWFYRKPIANEAPTVRDIHNSLGNFLAIPTAGKRGARLGQAFSTTTSTVEVPSSQIVHLPDIKNNGYCFSDGIGVISEPLAKTVARKLGLDHTPSAFQIRYGGYKGMISVYPSKEVFTALRPSMKKFESNHCQLEICSVPGRMTCYLNRQTINILSSLGIPDSSFLSLYYSMIADLDCCFESNEAAKQVVFEHDRSSPVAKMLAAGVGIDDRHVYEWLSIMRSRLLLNVQLKARIIVPQGINLVGVLDETNTLPEGCIYFKSKDFKSPPHNTIVAVGRCPCLHPGDIRRLRFFENSKLTHLHDVLVFSSIGERPETDKMAGGDLDGDIYFCIWDPTLVPENDYPPMIPEIPTTGQNLNHCANSMEVVGDFYVDYLMNDNLGHIANTHVVICDLFAEGAKHELALKFAQAHSIAVDYAKSGIRAEVPKISVRLSYPDYMENTYKPSYESKRILGQLYRLSKSTRLKEPTHSIHQKVNTKILQPGYEDYLEDAYDCFYYYSNALYDVAYRYEIDSEIELISGYVRKLSRKVCRMKGLKSTEDVMERIRFAVSRVQKDYKDLFWSDFNEDTEVDDEEVLKKASAWYHCAYTYVWPDGYPPYLSFAWLAMEPMCVLFRKAYKN
ncbi:RNA-directed RNA polymerase [Thraustotheca clavata]|uniref:RNA-dependent RNA polymerase n=1 Tax=Thraustotheca clavata TaxID=74557 RepID=A0A1V9YNX3_9STRA|nr:RNA-directed RNA polymerase [Thraustotheca clavata]